MASKKSPTHPEHMREIRRRLEDAASDAKTLNDWLKEIGTMPKADAAAIEKLAKSIARTATSIATKAGRHS